MYGDWECERVHIRGKLQHSELYFGNPHEEEIFKKNQQNLFVYMGQDEEESIIKNKASVSTLGKWTDASAI